MTTPLSRWLVLTRPVVAGFHLAGDILGFAHGIGGGATLVQVKHLLRDIEQMMRETFPKSITVEAAIAAELWPSYCNPTQIHQVLLNLCVNARDAMPNGGTLTLRGENCRLDAAAAESIVGAKPGNWLVLQVADTGTGMAPETLARIWEPFFTTKPPDKGTGLGLAAVRGILETHSGFVTVDSALGRGTTFSVYLPAAESASLAASAEKVPTTAAGHGEGIFVVDDEASIRDAANAALSEAGYRVVTAADGGAAAALLATRATEFTLVITDLEMPVLGGVGFTRQIRSRFPAMKILWISGTVGAHAREEKAERMVFADAVLQKPFTTAALLNAVEALMHASVPRA